MAGEKRKTGYTLADKSKDEEDKLRKELAQQLSSDMKRLFKDKVLPDVVIRAGNREFHVHKIIFQEMAGNLYSEMMAVPGSCETEDIITLDNVSDPEELRQTLSSFYTDDDISSSVKQLRKYMETKCLDDLLEPSKTFAPIVAQNGESGFSAVDELNKDKTAEEKDANSTKTVEALAEKFVKKIIKEAQKTCMLSGNCILVNDNQNDKKVVDKVVSDKLLEISSKSSASCQESVTDMVNGPTTVENSASESVIVDPNAVNVTVESEFSRILVSDISTGELVKRELGLKDAPKACSLLGEDLLRKLVNGVACDCVVSVGDWEFPAHKCMLAARSSYFAMMLNGSWMESESEQITLEGVDAGIVKQMLLYIYGGVLDLDPECSIGGLVMVADMYDVVGMKSIVSLILNKDYCHFFHKPCPGCISGVPETLPLTMMYNMSDMCEKCVRWINRHKDKVWTAKSFALLPMECLDYCTQAAVKDLNLINIIESLLEFQRLNEKIPRLKWTDTVLHCVAMLMDSALEYASQNFVNIVSGREFKQLDGKSLGFNMRALEEIFSLVITSLAPGVACESFLSLHTFLTQIHKYIKLQEETNRFKYDRFSEEYTSLVEKLCKKCKEQLCLYIHQAVNTTEWFLLSQDLQKEIMDEANYVCIDSPGRGKMAARPRLTSMKKKPLSSEFRVSMKEYFDKHFGPKETFPSGAIEKSKSKLPKKTDRTKKKEHSKKEVPKKAASQTVNQTKSIGGQELKQASLKEDKSKTVVKSYAKEKTKNLEKAGAGDVQLKTTVLDKKASTRATSKSTSRTLPKSDHVDDAKITGKRIETANRHMTSTTKSVNASSKLLKSSMRQSESSKRETSHSLFANLRQEVVTHVNNAVSDECNDDITGEFVNQFEESSLHETEGEGSIPCKETVCRKRSQSADSSTFRPHFGIAPTMPNSHSDDSFFSGRQGQTTLVPNIVPTMDVKFVVPREFYEQF